MGNESLNIKQNTWVTHEPDGSFLNQMAALLTCQPPFVEPGSMSCW